MLHNNISTAEWVNRFSMKCIAGQKKRDVAGIYVRAERFSASYFDHVGYHQLADNQGPGASECAFPHRFMRDLAARHSNAA
jgi:hypothetical protein